MVTFGVRGEKSRTCPVKQGLTSEVNLTVTQTTKMGVCLANRNPSSDTPLFASVAWSNSSINRFQLAISLRADDLCKNLGVY